MSKLGDILKSWAGTPYAHGQGAKGRGVDCFQFCVAVAQELLDRPLKLGPVYAWDASCHDKKAAWENAQWFIEEFGFAPTNLLDPRPGDFGLCTYPGNRRRLPAHGFVVGLDPRVVWHSSVHVGVTTGSLAAQRHLLIGLYRHPSSEEWR